MSGVPDLSPLVAALGGGATAEEIGAWLERAFADGEAAWPGVPLTREGFAVHLARCVEPGTSLSALHVSDLYLVAACLRGSAEALSAFERTFVPELADVVRRVSPSLDAEEVVQAQREALFVGTNGAPPRLAEYKGKGALRAWLRVVLTRAALNAATRGPRERPAADDDTALLDATGGVESPEIAYFRIHYEAAVKAELPPSLASLSTRDRLLLRQHYVDHLSLDAMARMHAVHVATVKRQLADAKSRLTEALRERLRERLGLSPSELESVLAIVQSRFHVTMQRLLPD